MMKQTVSNKLKLIFCMPKAPLASFFIKTQLWVCIVAAFFHKLNRKRIDFDDFLM